MKKYIAIALFALLALGGACSRSADSGSAAAEAAQQAEATDAAPVRIDRLDDFISGFAILTPQARQAGIDSLRPGLEALWALKHAAPAAGVTDAEMSRMADSKAFKVFAPDIAQRFGAADSVAGVLGMFAANLDRQLPDIHLPHLYGAVISYNQGIILMGDTVMLVGLNHYLGADYPGYAAFPDWQRELKTPARLPIDIAEAVLATQTPEPADGTALSRMIHYGAVLAAMLRTLPGIDAATALGVAPGQWQWLQQHEGQMWQKMIADNLLYSTDPAVARRLTAPGPSTSLLHPEAPGRAGAYVGWRIVEEYMAHASDPARQTVAYVLSPEFASLRPQTILTEAAYSPQ